MQPTGESTETNTNNQQGTAGEEQPTGGPLQIPEQGDTGLQPTQLGIDLNNEKAWQLNYAWLGTSCFVPSRLSSFIQFAPLPSLKPLLCLLYTSIHLFRIQKAHPLDTTCGSGSGNAQFWCSKIFASPVPGRPGKADICLTLDMIDRMEANGEFKNEMHPLILPPWYRKYGTYPLAACFPCGLRELVVYDWHISQNCRGLEKLILHKHLPFYCREVWSLNSHCLLTSPSPPPCMCFH